jgi:ABC-2 type transport system permease protein
MNVLTICRKELSSYFRSPIAYGVMFFFALVAGYMFWAATSIFIRQSLQSVMMGQQVPMDVNEWVIRSVLSNVGVIFLFIVPIVSMRVFAEEKNKGTIELLMTSPVRDSEIILGKWLAMVVLFACMLAVSLINIVTLYMYGRPDWRPMLVGYLGLLLQGAAMLAIGAFISSTTRNQIIAAAGTFGVLLMFWIIGWTSSLDNSTTTRVISYLSINDHIESFSKGVLDTKDIVFFLTFTILGLFLTSRSMESMRWRA